jgi:GntR family transcriptional regulator, rspAB operon transcriptional repressor
MGSSALSDKAYNIVKEKITNFEKGKYLSARAYSNEIGMSYTPVREAFLRLQKEGFLKRIPNVGFFVVHLDIKDIMEIYQVRECLEKFVLDLVFDMISDDEIQEMAKYIEKQKIALKKGDIRMYVKSDEQFHFVYFKLCNNKHFIDLLKNVHEQFLICSNRIAKSNSAEGIDEHVQILEQIKAKNKEEANQLLTKHIENAKARMKEGFISDLNL